VGGLDPGRGVRVDSHAYESRGRMRSLRIKEAWLLWCGDAGRRGKFRAWHGWDGMGWDRSGGPMGGGFYRREAA
jgi:hypothetical protein